MRSLLRVGSLLTTLALAASAGAQEPATAPSASGTKPIFNADTFKLPPSAYDVDKFKVDTPQDKGASLNPGQFSLGSSVLQFDAKRRVPDHAVGIETIDPRLLGNIQKPDPTLPNYFGMTLSKPLN